MKCPNCNGQMIQDIRQGLWRCLNCNFVTGAKNANSKQKKTEEIGHR